MPMGGMTFGRQETITCLMDLPIPGPQGEALCLGHKFTVRHILGPVSLTDDGYVLKDKLRDSYYPLDAARIGELQASGALPAVLPPYHIGIVDYLFGYALWIMLPVAFVLVKVIQRARRQEEAAVASIPISSEPPKISTTGDRFITAQLERELRPRETVSHQGYALSSAAGLALFSFGVKGYFVALTERRLILIETGVSGFRLVLQNRGVESIDRARIAEVQRIDANLEVRLTDGTRRTLVVDLRPRRFSNQVPLLLDLPRLFPGGAAEAGHS
jgi:hypothetical protein